MILKMRYMKRWRLSLFVLKCVMLCCMLGNPELHKNNIYLTQSDINVTACQDPRVITYKQTHLLHA